MSRLQKVVFHSFCVSSLVVGAYAQQGGTAPGQPPTANSPASNVTANAATANLATPPNYVVHPEDEITIRSLQVKELADKAFRVDQNGEINFPLLGRMHLAGETTGKIEADLTTKLKTFYHDPDVAVSITVFHDEPVSVIGAVGTPGVHSMHGQSTLLDMLSSAGGVRGDAGGQVKISRDSRSYGPIPYPTAHAVGPNTSMVELDLKGLMNGSNASGNIVIQPHDVISVPPAELVYVIGNVKKAGGIPLGGKPDLTVLQAISLAEGLDKAAAAKNTRILRRESDTAPNTARLDIPVDVAAMLKGKAPDVLLRPNDILYVPSSTAKIVTQRTIEAAIAVTTGMLILGR